MSDAPSTDSPISMLLHEVCDRLEAEGGIAAWGSSHFSPANTGLVGVVFTVVGPHRMLEPLERGLEAAASIVYEEICT